jgi:hypothetical protein
LGRDNCHQFARCANTIGAFTCTCKSGFEGNGTLCEDVQAPVLSVCPSDIDEVLGDGQGTLNAFFDAPTATDNSGDATVSCTATSGQPFAVGTSTVTCTASDAAENKDSCDFTVIVRDEEAPVWACEDLTAATGMDSATATVSFFVPPVTDNVLVSSKSCNRTGTEQLGVGTHTVTCTALDSSDNTASCSYRVVVVDGQAPGMTCKSEAVMPAPGERTAEVSHSATATDNVDGSVAVSCNRTSPEVLAVGIYGVRCEASDTAGNMGLCVFVVQVRDDEPPQVTCPGPLSVPTDVDSGTSTIDVASLVEATDNLDELKSVTCDVTEFDLGTQQTTCTVGGVG